MTKMEAYDAMVDGMAVSHKNFGPNEFLYMDNNYVIRTETDEEFETQFDTRKGDMWETDWFVFKNRTAIDKLNSSKEKLIGGYIEAPSYQKSIQNKHIDAFIDEAVNSIEQKEDNIEVIEEKSYCQDLHFCKVFKDKIMTCQECNNLKYKYTKLYHSMKFIIPILELILIYAGIRNYATFSDTYKYYGIYIINVMYLINMSLFDYIRIIKRISKQGAKAIPNKTNKVILLIALFLLVSTYIGFICTLFISLDIIFEYSACLVIIAIIQRVIVIFTK